MGICPEAKVMMALKQLAYGTSPSAFLDYFQMGETTGRTCSLYLRKMTKDDTINVSNLHKKEFGVLGLHAYLLENLSNGVEGSISR